MKPKKETVTLDQIADAIMAHWLRHAVGPNIDQIAALLPASVRAVRAAIRETAPRKAWSPELPGVLDESHIPGFKTIEANRHYHTPVTWEPTVAKLRAQVRGEGADEHDWIVRGRVMPLGENLSYGGYPREYKIIARTEGGARKAAIDLALKEFPAGLHSNTNWKVEWHGRHFVGTLASVEAAVEAAVTGTDGREATS